MPPTVILTKDDSQSCSLMCDIEFGYRNTHNKATPKEDGTLKYFDFESADGSGSNNGGHDLVFNGVYYYLSKIWFCNETHQLNSDVNIHTGEIHLFHKPVNEMAGNGDLVVCVFLDSKKGFSRSQDTYAQLYKSGLWDGSIAHIDLPQNWNPYYMIPGPKSFYLYNNESGPNNPEPTWMSNELTWIVMDLNMLSLLTEMEDLLELIQ